MTGILSSILSIITAIAMVFSPAGELTDTTEVTTVSNIVLEVNDDTYATEAQLRTTETITEDMIAAGFSVLLGDQTLLPMDMKLTAEAVDVKLGKSSVKYTLTEQDIIDIIGDNWNEESAATLSLMTSLVRDYCGTLMIVKDPETAAPAAEKILNALFNGIEPVTETITVEGTEYEALRYDLNMGLDSMPFMMDNLMTCGVEPVENYLKDMIAFLNLMDGTEYTTFGEAIGTEFDGEDTFNMPITLVIMMSDDLVYESASMDWEFDENNGMTMFAESVVNAEGAEETLSMDVTVDGSPIIDCDAEIIYGINGGEIDSLSVNAAISRNFAMDLYLPSDYSADDAEESEEVAAEEAETVAAPYTHSENGTSVTVTVNAEKTDGLWNGTAAMDISNGNSHKTYDADGELTDEFSYKYGVGMTAGIECENNEDGSVTKHVALGVTYSDESTDAPEEKPDGALEVVRLSFDVTKSEEPYTDVMATAESTENLTDVGESGMVMPMLSLLADVEVLTEDEGISKLLSDLTADAYDVPDYEEVTEDAEDADEDSTVWLDTVTDLSELGEYYAGPLPVFPVPDGYEVRYACVNSDAEVASVSYYRDNALMMDITLYNFPGANAFIVEGEDTETTEVCGCPAALYKTDDGLIESITIVLDADNCMDFYFYEPVDAETAQALLATVAYEAQAEA